MDNSIDEVQAIRERQVRRVQAAKQNGELLRNGSAEADNTTLLLLYDQLLVENEKLRHSIVPVQNQNPDQDL